MSITADKMICLHALADDLKFLDPVRNRMGKLLGESFRGFSFGELFTTLDLPRCRPLCPENEGVQTTP
jgi:hypothetical protein